MTDRIVGIDLARFAALLGIIFVHTNFFEVETLTAPERVFYFFGNGVAPAIFALLVGVSLKISWTRRSTSLKEFAKHTAWRAAFLGSFGLALGGVGSPIAIILFNLAVLMGLGLCFLSWRHQSLFITSFMLALLAPLLSYGGREIGVLPPFSFENFTLQSLTQPLDLVSSLFFTGYYPLVFWLAYLTLGMGLGSLHTMTRAMQVRVGSVFALMGASVFAVSHLLTRDEILFTSLAPNPALGLFGTPPLDPTWLLTAYPHGGTPFTLLLMGSWAGAILALSLALAGPTQKKLALVLTYGGGFTFTLYTLHVILYSAIPFVGDYPDSFWAHLIAVLVATAILLLLRGRGSMEDLSRRFSSKMISSSPR